MLAKDAFFHSLKATSKNTPPSFQLQNGEDNSMYGTSLDSLSRLQV